MSDSKNIIVDLGDRSYTIVVAPGSVKSLNQQAALQNLGSVFLISDSNVAAHYLQSVAGQLKSCGNQVETIVVPAGEKSKSVEMLERVWNELLCSSADRSATVVALGGGVVGDLAGFAAATFGRGINFIQIPTSLLAQVDSSVGGKTGINLPGSKNMVGSFWQPQFVLIDPSVLDTLDQANYRSGLAEVVKYGVIMDENFFELLENKIAPIVDRDCDTLTQIIARCCELKAQVVKADELETSGTRAILNYGHTFGHAIENVFGYGKYLHGEAVSIGIHCAGLLGKKLNLVDQAFVSRQQGSFATTGPANVPRRRIRK